jgi:hypothetical protein
MKLAFKIFFSFLCVVSCARAQNSPNELGVFVFNAFKEGRLESLPEKRLKQNQLDSFFIWLGRDIKSNNYLK